MSVTWGTTLERLKEVVQTPSYRQYLWRKVFPRPRIRRRRVRAGRVILPAQYEIMKKLYGHDVWQGFRARRANAEVQGWNGNHPAFPRLVAEAGGKRPVIVVDVGTWKGQSTITLANSIKQQGIDGCVISVDTFLGSREHWDEYAHLLRRINGFPDLYRTFLDNVWHAGVFDYVVPLPQTSIVAAQIIKDRGIAASLIHIDASHEYEDVLHDAESYWDLLLPGGYLVGDDYSKYWPGVTRAADEFSERVGCQLSIESPKWILQKPSSSEA